MSDNPAGLVEDSSVYRTLLESTKAIPWKINWRTMRFEYIGPQIEALLGWPQDRAAASFWVGAISIPQGYSGILDSFFNIHE